MSNIDEMRKKFHDIFKYCETPQHVIDKWEKFFDNCNTNPVMDKAIEIITAQVANVKKLSEVFSSVDNDIYARYREQEKPLITLHPTDFTQLRVYENIIISSHNDSDLDNISIFDAGIVFKTFMANYTKDMSNEIPNSSQKWETPERIEKRLNTYIDMPTARALSRYTNLDKLYPPEKNTRIRDFALGVDDYRKPMELSFAETPEDFCIAYGSGPSSCMTLHGGNAAKFKWMWDNKFCPASFYAYFPYTRGAYIAKNKKVIARTILFKDPNDEKKWSYGRIYADTNEITTKFISSMEAVGITSLEKRADYTKHRVFTVPDGTSFKIPGVPYSKPGVMCMPWPFFDNMEYHGKGFYASYDKKTNEFIITFNSKGNKDKEYLPVQNQNGVLLSVDYSDKQCDYCKQYHREKGFPWQMTNDGGAFDSLECMLASGYVRVMTGIATHYQKPDPHLIPIQGVNKSVFFSTMKAAKDSQYLPLLTSDGLVPEEGDIEVTNQYQHVEVIDGVEWCMKQKPIEPRNSGLTILFNTPIRNVELDVLDDGWYPEKEFRKLDQDEWLEVPHP